MRCGVDSKEIRQFKYRESPNDRPKFLVLQPKAVQNY